MRFIFFFNQKVSVLIGHNANEKKSKTAGSIKAHVILFDGPQNFLFY